MVAFRCVSLCCVMSCSDVLPFVGVVVECCCVCLFVGVRVGGVAGCVGMIWCCGVCGLMCCVFVLSLLLLVVVCCVCCMCFVSTWFVMLRL